jgi:hypothetical protein
MEIYFPIEIFAPSTASQLEDPVIFDTCENGKPSSLMMTAGRILMITRRAQYFS